MAIHQQTNYSVANILFSNSLLLLQLKRPRSNLIKSPLLQRASSVLWGKAHSAQQGSLDRGLVIEQIVVVDSLELSTLTILGDVVHTLKAVKHQMCL